MALPDWLQNFKVGPDGQYYDASSQRGYVPIYGSGSYNGMDNYTPGELQGYRGYNWYPGMVKDSTQLEGTPYDAYDAQGNQTGTGTWKGLAADGLFGKFTTNPGLGAAAVLSLPFVASGLQGTFGGAGSAGGTLSKAALDGTTAFGANSVPGAYELGSGLTTSAMSAGAGGLGEGAIDLGGGLSMGPDGSIMGATPGMTSGMSNAQILSSVGAGGGGPGYGGGLLGGGGGDGSMDLGGGINMGADGSITGATPPNPSTMSNADILKSVGASGGNGLLGPLTSLVGGILGSQGKQESATLTKTWPAALDPYLTGPNGLFPRTHQLMNESTPGFAQMRDVGLGLLNKPVAQNGYGLLGNWSKGY